MQGEGVGRGQGHMQLHEVVAKGKEGGWLGGGAEVCGSGTGQGHRVGAGQVRTGQSGLGWVKYKGRISS